MTYDPPVRWKLPEYTWGQERELCRRCTHYRERIGGTENAGRYTVMACAINKKSTLWHESGTCIDMRYDGPCGREGKLFQERQA